MLGEWYGAAVDPGTGSGPPDPDVWTPVDAPDGPPPFEGADAVAYRTAFDDPRSPGDARAVLELRGLYAHARVWLNGDDLGSHDAYFRPFRASFEPDPTNELVVECRAPEDRFGGVHDTDAVPDVDAVPGIWWGADVETHPETFLFDLDASPRLVDGGAAIDVRAVVETTTPVDDRLTLSLRPEGEFQSRGMMDRAAVAAAAGERAVVEHTIEVRDPTLWWPRELGPQHRYGVRAKLDDATRSVTLGLCEVALGAEGLLVNGERLPVRGVNLLSATTDDVEDALTANANLVRMHAHAPAHDVYERCSEAGLLVWQDLPLTGPGGFDVDRGRDLAEALAATYGRHPCLAAFSVVDDPVDPFPDVLGAGALDRLRVRWRGWRTSYDRGAAEAVADALPADRPVFPVAGPLGSDPDAAHLYPGWDYGDPADAAWLADRYGFDVVGEFGAGALGSDAPEDLAGFDAAKHDAHVDDGTGASQRYQARVVKGVAEALRRRGTAVVSHHALRDAGDAGMGVLERDGTPKDAYRALATAYEPVQATLTDPAAGATSDVVVVNDTGAAVSGRLEWEAGGAEGDAAVAVDAHEAAPVATVSLPADAGTATLTLAADDHVAENRYYL